MGLPFAGLAVIMRCISVPFLQLNRQTGGMLISIDLMATAKFGHSVGDRTNISINRFK
ncbi:MULTISPECIES: hypothetical protein [unclassified Bradyrhizobium]|uniref:hypothetical protein n=1 Tax=unclassified Bradyrhizobium TaxID=2631580 RepID=UPI0028EB341F|nr:MULTISPECIES: hypothetical protein [unclassified Bradyrhizobium]